MNGCTCANTSAGAFSSFWLTRSAACSRCCAGTALIATMLSSKRHTARRKRQVGQVDWPAARVVARVADFSNRSGFYLAQMPGFLPCLRSFSSGDCFLEIQFFKLGMVDRGKQRFVDKRLFLWIIRSLFVAQPCACLPVSLCSARHISPCKNPACAQAGSCHRFMHRLCMRIQTVIFYKKLHSFLLQGFLFAKKDGFCRSWLLIAATCPLLMGWMNRWEKALFARAFRLACFFDGLHGVC